MLVSSRGRYALMFMIYVARANRVKTVAVHSVAEAEGLSAKYLEQLAHALVKARLLTGIRGKGGGYHLARKASTITAGDILRAVEGSTSPVDCPVLEKKGTCPRQDVCATVDFWKGLGDVIDNYVDGVTLHDLIIPEHGCACGWFSG